MQMHPPPHAPKPPLTRVLAIPLSSERRTGSGTRARHAQLLAHAYKSPTHRSPFSTPLTWQMLGSLLVNVAGHIFFFLSVLALAKLYERQHSHGDKEKEMMIKMTVFQVPCLAPPPRGSPCRLFIGEARSANVIPRTRQVLSIVMQAVLFLYIEVNANQYQLSRHQGRFGAAWYVSGAQVKTPTPPQSTGSPLRPNHLPSLTAQVVLVALVGDTFVINLGMDLFRPVPDLVNRYIFARKAKTQASLPISSCAQAPGTSRAAQVSMPSEPRPLRPQQV